MNRLWMTMWMLMADAVAGADAGGAGGATDGAGSGAAAGDAAAGAGAGGDAGTGQGGDAAGQAGDKAAEAAPDDLMAQLEAAMAAQLGEPDEKAAADGKAGQAGQQDADAIPEAFKAALEVSPFVTTPEGVTQAVQAADELWRVAAGELPARTMLEGFRQTNPQQYEAIVKDLAAYIAETTGVDPAQGARGEQESPLAGLAKSHPAIFTAVQDFVKKNAGVDLAGTPDPREARLSAMEQQFAAEQQARETQQWNQRVEAARGKAIEFLSAKTKGTFAEGHEAYLLMQCGSRAGIPEAQMIDMILSGKTQRLESAYKAVVKEEVARLKAYNGNLIKGHRALANGVPGATGAKVRSAAAGSAPARKDGESDVAYATRMWESGAAVQ
jgi:hypothetical protein